MHERCRDLASARASCEIQPEYDTPRALATLILRKSRRVNSKDRLMIGFPEKWFGVSAVKDELGAVEQGPINVGVGLAAIFFARLARDVRQHSLELAGIGFARQGRH